MEFGIFATGLAGPRPWNEPARFQQELELAVQADRSGYHTFWAPEHHCLEEYSHCSASHLACLAVGMRTERIRLVTGIFNLCPAINHPVRVAEQIALIDIYTNGRIELGTGRGSGSTEVNTFGLRNDQTRGMWEEAIRAIPQMWTRDDFSWEGEHFSVPERNVLPKPVQKPHPPLWVTATNPSTVEVAARMGLGVAVFSFQDPAELAPLVETYKTNIEKAEPVGAFVNNKVMAITPTLCLEDGDEARAVHGAAGTQKAHFSIYFDTIPDHAEKLRDEPHPIPQSRLRELIRHAEDDPSVEGAFATGALTPEFLESNGLCIGDPEQVTRTVRRYRDVGIDQLVTVPVVGPHAPFEKLRESVRTFGERVIPSFP